MDKQDLIDLIEASGLQQKELARRIGISETTMSRWVQGHVPIKSKYVPMIEYFCKESTLNDGIIIERDVRLDDMSYEMLEEAASALGVSPQSFLEALFTRFARLLWGQMVADKDMDARVYGLPAAVDDGAFVAAEEGDA